MEHMIKTRNQSIQRQQQENAVSWMSDRLYLRVGTDCEREYTYICEQLSVTLLL